MAIMENMEVARYLGKEVTVIWRGQSHTGTIATLSESTTWISQNDGKDMVSIPTVEIQVLYHPSNMAPSPKYADTLREMASKLEDATGGRVCAKLVSAG